MSRSRILFSLVIFVLISACKKPIEEQCGLEQVLFLQAEYPIGVAVDPVYFGLPEYETLLREQFNSITPENIFKPSYLHPQEDNFFWLEADELVARTQQNNQRLHGHTLIWHQQLPNWMQNYQGSQADWEDLFKNHIQSICRHFKGEIASWDVVNEAFNEDGTLRNSIWRQHLGDGYIEKAFRYAHEADPQALLFYNDYNFAYNEPKREAIINFLLDLKQRDVPIHGIGMQMHIAINYPTKGQISAAIQAAGETGFLVHLSEVDVAVNPFNQTNLDKETLFARQAEKLASLVVSYNALASRYQYGISFWGLSDADSWLPSYYNREDYPLLFDHSYQPKPAYCKLMDVL